MDLLAFLGVAVLIIVTPGPDTALTVRNALVGGRRSGIFTAVGVATGQSVWTLATSAGVAALLVASEPAFTALKLAGAAYLVFLGGQALCAALRSNTTHKVPRTVSTDGAAGRAYRQGVISNLGNPKMAVFFASLLPQFAGETTSFFALLGLGLMFCLLTLVWLTGYAVLVAKAGELFRRSAIRRALDAVTGAVLIALGLRVATSQR